MLNGNRRVIALVLALTLVVSLLAGTTLAKYVTTGETKDNARVAKWGVKVNAENATDANAFSTTYGNQITSTAGTQTSAIVSATTDNVLAPGASGTFAGFGVEGTPEVAVKVTTDATVTLTGWTVGEDVYFPITINNQPYSGSIEAIKAAIEQALSTTVVYGAGENIADTDAGAISWAWPFSTEGNDANDTALADTTSSIDITFMVTVEQIQETPAAGSGEGA